MQIRLGSQCLILILLASFHFSLRAQELQEQVEVELVQVDVVANDSRGQIINDLTAEDFILKENGVEQKISHFYNAANDESRVPLTVSFLVDTSYSMHELVAGMTRIQIAVKAADLVIEQMTSQDQAEVIEFNKEPVALVPFTSDFDEVEDKLSTLEFQKASTSMHDAVVFAVNRLQGRSGRKLIVIFSDGMDSSSKAVEEDVIESIRKSDVTVISFYSEFARLNFPAINTMPGGPGSPNRVMVRAGEDILREYSDMTGGEFYSFKKEQELLDAMERFRKFVGGQYSLAYGPPKPTKNKPEWRKFKIECKRKGVKLQYREGYWAPAKTS